MANNKLGQATIIGLVLVFISAVVLSVLSPVLNEFIVGQIKNNSEIGTSVKLIADLIIPILWLVIIITALSYTTPERE